MALLDHAPNELLAEIVSYLDGPDLLSISFVSRRLRTIAEPSLYRTVYLTYDGSTPSSFQLFFRTILNRPDLALCVQALVLRWTTDEVEETTLTECETTQSTNVGDLFVLLNPYSMAKRSTTWTEYLKLAWNGWRHKCQESMPVTWVIALMFRLPNLRCLDILAPQYPFHIITNLIHRNVHLPQSERPISLLSLRELQIKSSDYYSDISGFTFLTLLQLNSLRKLSIDEVEGSHEYGSLPCSCFTSPAPITHLNIGLGSNTTTNEAFSMMNTRTITHLDLECQVGYKYMYSIPELGLTLLPMRDTLQQLTVHLDIVDNVLNFTDDPISIGSLREWPLLRSVRCSLTLFLGREPGDTPFKLVEMLPRGIVEFVADVDREWNADDVGYEVLEMVREKEVWGLGQLREVAVVGNVQCNELVASCEAAGVVLLRQKARPWNPAY